MRLIELLRLLRSILKIPSIEDEEGLRTFLTDLFDALAVLASYTPTKADDLGAAALRAIVTNDATWAAFYRLIKFAQGADDIPSLVAATGLGEDQLLALRDAIHA
ncbi:hypothetical protein [Thermogutta sp.]|jgi:hypothetical protein|uniref:hypothetical protein n=1 Tax=Thermogutta sp. TaxID=1962930 RepID=UPI0032203314